MRIGTIQRYWWLAISDDCQELMLVKVRRNLVLEGGLLLVD